MSVVYILQNEKGMFYIGSTTSLARRMKEHFSGYTKTTHRMGKFKLVFTQNFDSLKEARIIELKLKKLKRHDYLAKIVQDGFLSIKP